MRAVSKKVIRPLIERSRDEIEGHLEQMGQIWREDVTNEDTRFARNRLRHVVIPTLTSEFNPRLKDTLSRTIDILEAEDDWMNRTAEEWLEGRTSQDGPALVVDIGDLAPLPVAFVRRVLRVSLKLAGSTIKDIGFKHIENVRSLLVPGKSGRVIELPGTLSAERNFNTLVFRPADAEPADYEYELPIPGQVHVSRNWNRFRGPDCDRRAPLNLSKKGSLSMVNRWGPMLRLETGGVATSIIRPDLGHPN